MYGDHPPARTRAGSIAAVVAIHLVLGYALVSGLAVDFPGRVADSLHTFSLDVPPPPPVEPPRPKPRPATERAPKKEGAASPPNLTARATEVVAPPIVIPPPQPPPIVVAPKASTGAADHSGAAPIPGSMCSWVPSSRPPVPSVVPKWVAKAPVTDSGSSGSL